MNNFVYLLSYILIGTEEIWESPHRPRQVKKSKPSTFIRKDKTFIYSKHNAENHGLAETEHTCSQIVFK